MSFETVTIGDCTLILGDCMEVLPTLGRFDAVITDPPYGIFKKTGGDGKMFGKETIYSVDDKAAGWDSRPSKQMLDLVIASGEKWVIWGGNYFASDLGDCKGPLLWNKLTGNNSYADGELAWSNVTGTLRILNHQWCGAFKDSERGERAVHPTQKPIEVMKWCIDFVPKAKTILDPFMGSGTTGVAAIQLGRKFTGIEREPKYFDIACQRIEQAYAQGVLFEPEQPKQVQTTLMENL